MEAVGESEWSSSCLGCFTKQERKEAGWAANIFEEEKNCVSLQNILFLPYLKPQDSKCVIFLVTDVFHSESSCVFFFFDLGM
jgi:hypothetical protein